MELYQIVLIVLGVIFVTILLYVLLHSPRQKKKEVELPSVFELLDKKNIIACDFIRNKIVITFHDVTLFNTEKLHEKGAKGISIVGEKVKFYFDGENQFNEELYKKIKKYIEG